MAEPKWVEVPLALDAEFVSRFTTPDYQYYSTHMSGALYTYGSTTSARRQGLVNWLPQKSGDSTYLMTREGLGVVNAVFGKGTAVQYPRGIFFLPSMRMVVELWEETAYVATAVDTYVTSTGWGATNHGPGGICEGITTAGAVYGFLSTTTKSATIAATTGAMTTISDGDFPTNIIPTPVFLDSYIFVAERLSRKIFNSAVGDPTSWSASTYTSTEDYGGNIVALGRHHGSLVAFCENHIEFFRDAAVPAPNSPLLRDQSKTIKVGCINRATIANHGDVTYFAGKDASGSIGIFKLEDFKVTKISTATIDWLTSGWGGSAGRIGTLTSWGVVARNSANNHPTSLHATAYMMPMHGKWYYTLVFNLGAGQYATNVMTSFPAFVYDTELKLWIEIGYSQYHEDSTVTTLHGGWPPYGCQQHTGFTSASTYRFLMQNPYGGADDDHLAYLTPNIDAGEVVNMKAGSFAQLTNAAALCMIQTAPTTYGTASRKLISGFYAGHQKLMTGSVTTSSWGQSGTANAYLAFAAGPVAEAYSSSPGQEHALITLGHAPPDEDHAMRIVKPLFTATQIGMLYQVAIANCHGVLGNVMLRIHALEGPA